MAVSREPITTTSVGGLLERSAQLDALGDHLGAVRAQGRGRLVLVGGEAGIGKTTLVRAFCEEQRPVRLLWGACDALYTPRPLGPFADMAQEAGGELGAVVEEGATPAVLVAALAGELGRRSPSVVVLEDLHWADEATLDVVRLLARRIESVPALVLATYRDDELDRAHPLRIVLGELPASHDRPDRAGAALAGRGRRPGRSGGRRPRRAASPDRRQPVLRDRGARDRRRRHARDGARRGAGARSRAWTPARWRCWTSSRSSRSAPSCGCWRRWRTATWRRSTRAWPPACCTPSATPSASATRSRASRSSRRSRRTGGWRCIARRSRRWRRMVRAPTRPASPTTPRPPTTPTRCCATRRTPARRRPRWDHTARRRPSSPARCATRTASRPRGAPSCWSAARTSAT